MDIPKEVPHGGQNIGFEHWRKEHSARSDSQNFWIPQLPPNSSYSTRWADVVQNERFAIKGSRGRSFDIVCDQTEIINRKEKRRAERFFQGVDERLERRRREGTSDFRYDSRGSDHPEIRDRRTQANRRHEPRYHQGVGKAKRDDKTDKRDNKRKKKDKRKSKTDKRKRSRSPKPNVKKSSSKPPKKKKKKKKSKRSPPRRNPCESPDTDSSSNTSSSGTPSVTAEDEEFTEDMIVAEIQAPQIANESRYKLEDSKMDQELIKQAQNKIGEQEWTDVVEQCGGLGKLKAAIAIGKEAVAKVS